MNEHDFEGSGPKQILVCAYGADCMAVTKQRHGSHTAIYDAIKAARNAKGLNKQLYVVRTSCQGWCESAPVCQLQPGGRIYKDLTPEEAPAFVDACLSDQSTVFETRQIWDYSASRAENLKRKSIE